MLKDKLKYYKVEIISTAVILINAVIIKKDLKQIKEMKKGQKMIIFK